MQIQITDKYTVTHEHSAKIIMTRDEAELVRRALSCLTSLDGLQAGFSYDEYCKILRIRSELEMAK